MHGTDAKFNALSAHEPFLISVLKKSGFVLYVDRLLPASSTHKGDAGIVKVVQSP